MTRLRELALELSSEGLQDGMIPFALIAASDGLKKLTIVTDRSNKAAYLGRRLVREQGGDEYAIAVDTFLRIDGVRHDAILVESGTRESHAAEVTAHTYAAGKFAAVHEMGTRPSALHAWDPFGLDWGGVTPDFVNEDQNAAVLVGNHRLESAESVARTVRFFRARAEYLTARMPPGGTCRIFLDDRGQTVSAATRAELLRGLAPSAVQFLSEMKR
jgi:hypothetical protein